MPIDTSIYQAFAPRQRGALEYAQDFVGLDAAKEAQAAQVLNRQMGQAKFDEYQRGVQKATALEQLMGSMAGKSEAEVLQGLRDAGRYNEAGVFDKGIADRQKIRADAAKDNALADDTTQKTKEAKKKSAIYDIAVMPDIESVRASIAAKVAGPEKLPQDYADALLRSLPQDVAELPRWKHDLIMKMASPESQQTAATAAAGQAQTAGRDAQVARNNLVGPDGRVNQALLDAKTRIAAAGAASNVTYGSPVAGVVDGKPTLVQPGNRGGPAVPMTTSDGRPIAPPDKSAGNKPMPAAALKMQQDELDAIGTSAKLDSTLADIEQKLTTGKLQLGPINNLVSLGRNLAGMSSEQSKEFALLKTNLQNMRNDVLMMHKGVQTEGDAQRAMQTLMDNLNDPAIVKAQLARLRDLQQRAVLLRQNNVQLIRRNYEQPDIDMTPYSGGATPPGAKPNKWTIERE